MTEQQWRAMTQQDLKLIPDREEILAVMNKVAIATGNRREEISGPGLARKQPVVKLDHQHRESIDPADILFEQILLEALDIDLDEKWNDRIFLLPQDAIQAHQANATGLRHLGSKSIVAFPGIDERRKSLRAGDSRVDHLHRRMRPRQRDRLGEVAGVG